MKKLIFCLLSFYYINGYADSFAVVVDASSVDFKTMNRFVLSAEPFVIGDKIYALTEDNDKRELQKLDFVGVVQQQLTKNQLNKKLPHYKSNTLTYHKVKGWKYAYQVKYDDRESLGIETVYLGIQLDKKNDGDYITTKGTLASTGIKYKIQNHYNCSNNGSNIFVSWGKYLLSFRGQCIAE